MPSLLTRWFIKATEVVDRRIGWDKLPPWIGLGVLIGVRDALREHNLYDSYRGNPPAAPAHTLPNTSPSGPSTAPTTICRHRRWVWPTPGSGATCRWTRDMPSSRRT